MTRKNKLLISNGIFFLTAFIAVWILFVKTANHSQIIYTVSYTDILILLIPIILIIITIGLLYIIIGMIILYHPVFISFKKTEPVLHHQSLAKIDSETKNHLIELAKPYHKTLSQLVLNYQVNQGLVVIPKSHSKQHQFENIDVFDFELTKTDIQMIKAMNNE